VAEFDSSLLRASPLANDHVAVLEDDRHTLSNLLGPIQAKRPAGEHCRASAEPARRGAARRWQSPAIASADSLRRIVERTKFFDEGARLTISLGVAATPEDSQTPAGLVQAADGALYRAKSVGRNQVRAA